MIAALVAAGRHLADLPHHARAGRGGSTTGGFRWGQIGTGLAGLARPRHQRRAEDDGRHHAGADRLRAAGPTPRPSRSGSRSSCAVAIALGTYVGGWRIIRTLGKGLVEIEPPPGHGGRGRLGRGHPGLEPPRLRALDHPRRHRLDPRQRPRQAGCATSAGGSPDGWRSRGSSRSRWRPSSARRSGRSATWSAAAWWAPS